MPPAPTRANRILGDMKLLRGGETDRAGGTNGDRGRPASHAGRPDHSVPSAAAGSARKSRRTLADRGRDVVEVFGGVPLRPGEDEDLVERPERPGVSLRAVIHGPGPGEREGPAAGPERLLLLEHLAHECRLL